uniref:C3a anaphylatoxin chemotactic receptor n=1 Tax=Salmo trutta TaxID=8032 RepID=A0A674CM12_SALTR
MNGNYFEEDHDYSMSTYYDMFNETDESEQVNQSIRVVSMVIYSITCVLGIPGNGSVIWIAGGKMKRTVNTVWFVNLAVADLLCCISIPFSLADIILNQHWPFGEGMCKILPSAMYLNMLSSVFTLVLISLDRFVLIILPLWAQNHQSIALAWLLCGLAWVLALFLSLPTMIHNGTIDVATHVPRLVLGFLVPLLVIAVCYLLIGRRVSSARFKSQRAFRLILGGVAAFFVCLPRQVKPGIGTPWPSLWLTSTAASTLYVFIGQDFKDRVRVSLHKVFENVFSEDPSTLECMVNQHHYCNS